MMDLAMLHEVLNFFYPPHCAACGAGLPIETRKSICGGCLARIERLSDPLCAVCGEPMSAAGNISLCSRCHGGTRNFRMARSAARYDPSREFEPGTLGAIIRHHKYGRDQSLARALLECVGDNLPYRSGDHDLVIPVPLHRQRLRWRGFNQAALLGIDIARRLDCEFDLTAMMRGRATPPQTAHDHNARRRNVRNAFRVAHPRRVAGRRVLLIDDVMTTGATADECAGVLRQAGARVVDVFTLARAR
ncbi:MAG: ComF family protein [Candidatus Binataceae bacterium]|nr:ComF family protein [Candidatus Binataceae bacterium]